MLTLEDFHHGGSINLTKAEALQNFLIDMHESVEGLDILWFLELIHEALLGDGIREFLEPFRSFLGIVALVICLGSAKEDVAFQVDLENLSPDGDQLFVGAAIGVGELCHFFAKLLDLYMHALLFSFLEFLEAGQLFG